MNDIDNFCRYSPKIGTKMSLMPHNSAAIQKSAKSNFLSPILYITQIPKDRLKNHDEDYGRSREIFRINPEILKIMKKDTYIMHPLPRDHELPHNDNRNRPGSPGGVF